MSPASIGDSMVSVSLHYEVASASRALPPFRLRGVARAGVLAGRPGGGAGPRADLASGRGPSSFLLVGACCSWRAPEVRIEQARRAAADHRAASDVIFLGVAVVFLATIEQRSETAAALAAFKLRALVHMDSQLTRSRNLLDEHVRTVSRRADMTGSLARYLDYCSELLSLAGRWRRCSYGTG
jgi:hypothetical protein